MVVLEHHTVVSGKRRPRQIRNLVGGILFRKEVHKLLGIICYKNHVAEKTPRKKSGLFFFHYRLFVRPRVVLKALRPHPEVGQWDSAGMEA